MYTEAEAVKSSLVHALATLAEKHANEARDLQALADAIRDTENLTESAIGTNVTRAVLSSLNTSNKVGYGETAIHAAMTLGAMPRVKS